jgi:hypothetical protein
MCGYSAAGEEKQQDEPRYNQKHSVVHKPPFGLTANFARPIINHY